MKRLYVLYLSLIMALSLLSPVKAAETREQTVYKNFKDQIGEEKEYEKGMEVLWADKFAFSDPFCLYSE